MKAIVVRQPWATLIALGVKTIETRPAPPNGPMRPEGVRGLPGLPLERGERIAIVAGKAAPERGWAASDAHYFVARNGDGEWVLAHPGHLEPLPLGSVVCTVRVDDALPILDEAGADHFRGRCIGAYDDGLTEWTADELDRPVDHDDQLPLGDFTPGRWGWMLGDPQPCDPIPCKGRQGVFELPADVAREVLVSGMGGEG